MKKIILNLVLAFTLILGLVFSINLDKSMELMEDLPDIDSIQQVKISFVDDLEEDLPDIDNVEVITLL